MAYPINRYEVLNSSGGQPDTGRAPSAALWMHSLDQYADDPSLGTYVFNDFTDTDIINTTDASAVGGWFIQDATAGGTVESLVNIDSSIGEVVLSATTGTDHFGIEMHRGNSATSNGYIATSKHASAPRGRAVYETRVDLDDADTFFIGWTEPIVEFLDATSDLPTDSDYIGFYRDELTGDIQFVCANDNAGGTAVTDSATVLAAADIQSGYNKLGFAVEKDGRVNITVNGQYDESASTSINPLALPIEYLTDKFAITRGSTGDSATIDLPIDWVRTLIEDVR